MKRFQNNNGDHLLLYYILKEFANMNFEINSLFSKKRCDNSAIIKKRLCFNRKSHIISVSQFLIWQWSLLNK